MLSSGSGSAHEALVDLQRPFTGEEKRALIADLQADQKVLIWLVQIQAKPVEHLDADLPERLSTDSPPRDAILFELWTDG